MTGPVRADLLIAGRVATLAHASGWGWAEAIAIAGGRVVRVGSAADLEGLAGRGTVRWRLPADALVLPGITDAHLHLMTLALARTHVDLSATPDLPATLAVLARAHRQLLDAGDEESWLLGHGWSLHGLGRWPDAALLESACPGRAVALWSHDHHSRWVSRAALERAEVGPATADPEGGLIRREDDGTPTGILHETASAIVDEAIPDPPAAAVEQAVIDLAAELAAVGIVGCHDPGELTRVPRIRRGPLLYRAMAEADRLPLRVHASVRAAELDHAIELGLRSGEGSGRYTMGWLKLFTDGALGSRSAALLEPYEDREVNPPTGGPRGMFTHPIEELADQVRRAAAAGITAQIHAIGDAAVRAALDLLADQPDTILRRRVEHAQLVDPADIARFGALGVAASVQPVHLRSDAASARQAWGARAELAFPLAELAAGGALIPLGTDAPVEPFDPWPGIAVAVCRRDPFQPTDAPLGAAHAIDLPRAVRAACLDPALAAGESDRGRLTVGSRADLIIVPAAGFVGPFDAEAVASTRPLATLIDGALVYRAVEFEQPQTR